MLVGKGRGIPLTSCRHSPPPLTPSSPRASSLRSSAAPSPPDSSGCVFPHSPPSLTPLWNDGAPPSSRVLTCPSWSHPHASPDVYGTRGQTVSLLPPLWILSCVRSSFHQMLHLTERKTGICLLSVLKRNILSRLPTVTIPPLLLMKESAPAGSFALCTDCRTLRELSVFKRFPFILIGRNVTLPF